MESRENEFGASKRRFKILLTLMLALIGLFVMIQTFAFSVGGGTELISAQGPVITPTLTTDQKIQAYIEAHIIQGDVMPATEPTDPSEGEAVVNPQGSVVNGVAWAGGIGKVDSPGEVVTYSLTLSNTGTADDTYEVTAASGWAFSLPETTFPISSGTSLPVSVAITVPPAAMISDSDTAIITATSQTDAMVTAAVSLTTTAGSERIYLPLNI